jgi:hypothetical protein
MFRAVLTQRPHGPHSAYTAAQEFRKPPKPKADVAQPCLPDFAPYRGIASESASVYQHPNQLDVPHRHVLAAQILSNFQRMSATRSSNCVTLLPSWSRARPPPKAARTSGFRFEGRFEGYSASVSLNWQTQLFTCQAMLTDLVQHLRRRTVSSRLVLLALLLRYRRHEDDTSESCDTTDRLSRPDPNRSGNLWDLQPGPPCRWKTRTGVQRRNCLDSLSNPSKGESAFTFAISDRFFR